MDKQMGGGENRRLSRYQRGTVLATTDQEVSEADQEGHQVREEGVDGADRAAKQRVIRLLAHQRAVDSLQLHDPVDERTRRGNDPGPEDAATRVHLHDPVHDRALPAVHRDADAPLGHAAPAHRHHGADVTVPEKTHNAVW